MIAPRRSRIVAVVGGSGAGKSWFIQRLCELLGDKAGHLQLDDFYLDRSTLPLARRVRINFDEPGAIDWKWAERVLLEELRLFPASVRARSALAMLYAATGREADVARAIDEMLAASPGPSTFARAAELWDMFGRPDRAREIRARRR